MWLTDMHAVKLWMNAQVEKMTEWRKGLMETVAIRWKDSMLSMLFVVLKEATVNC